VYLIQRVVSSVVRAIHWIYKNTISPLMGNNCRFHPTCSDYAVFAIEQHGIFRGGWLSLKRVCKCHPWSDGGFDYVPDVKK
jgi:putative membrane protein insertion efficiency factor